MRFCGANIIIKSFIVVWEICQINDQMVMLGTVYYKSKYKRILDPSAIVYT